MSSSSPFRTEKNATYRWPPEPHSGWYKEYVRVTKHISDGEPKEWMGPYVTAKITEFLTERAGEILTYLVKSHGEGEGEFSLDQTWWNQELDNAYNWDQRQEQKRTEWDQGLSNLKFKPRASYKLKTALALTPPQKFVRYIKSAVKNQHRDEAAARGTEVHRIAEEIALGAIPEYDTALQGFVDNAQKFLEIYQPRFIEIESVVYSDKYGYAGQFDWLAEIPIEVMQKRGVWNPDLNKYEPWVDNRSAKRRKESPDSILVWGDYKTGTIKESIALQLSAYQYADYIGREDATQDPIPMADEYWGVSIRDDALEVIPVEVNEETFKAFLGVRDTSIWITQTRKRVLKRPLQEIA